MWDQVVQALNQSMIRLLREFASLLPGVVAFVLAVLLSILIAWALTFLLRRSLAGIQFDERIRDWGLTTLTEWSPARSPALLFVRVIAWTVILIGFLMGLAAFDPELTSELALRLFAYLPNVVAAIVVIVFGNIIARFLERNVLISSVNLNLQYARLLSLGVKWLVLVLAVAMALDHLAIGGSIVHLAFGILFGGIVFALALAVGLGSKELVSRSLERESTKSAVEVEEPFRHL